MKQKFLVIFTVLLTAIGCTSTDNKLESNASYLQTVNKYSDRAEFYEGFTNIFQVQATFLNSEVMQAQLDKKNKAFGWESAKFFEEKRKSDEVLRYETTYFYSFFSPDKKINDLDRVGSLWKIFLEVNGRKFEAKISKFSGTKEELQLYYPYHNEFANAYKVTFQIPTADIERSETKLLLTGPIGSKALTFKPLR